MYRCLCTFLIPPSLLHPSILFSYLFLFFFIALSIITLRAYARGKVIGRVVVVVVSTKIVISRDVDV